MNGRIESYLHSDRTTFNKGGALVRVTAQTDFGTRTEEFISFCRLTARMAYAAQAKTWDEVVSEYPNLELSRTKLEKDLKEKVAVEEIVILNL